MTVIIFSGGITTMKRIAFALILVGITGSLCFAEYGSTPPKEMTDSAPKVNSPTMTAPVIKTEDVIKVMTGTVYTVVVADAAKELKPEIVLNDDQGIKTSFAVEPTTTIYDANLAAITLDKVTTGSKATIKYTVKDGKKIAAAMNLMK